MLSFKDCIEAIIGALQVFLCVAVVLGVMLGVLYLGIQVGLWI